MKIICGTDFSIHAENAAQVAAAMARRARTTLRLVHALDTERLELLPPAQVDHLHETLRQKLLMEATRLRDTGAAIEESLEVGRPHEVLAGAAAAAKADLIVVSSLGRIAPSRWLVGSVAEKTAQLSKVPTLVVRNHESLLAWAKGEHRLKIFVGYDFSPSSDSALDWVAALLALGEGQVTVTYVSWPPRETWRFGIGGQAALAENVPEVQALLKRDLQERCARVFGANLPELRIVSGWGPVEEKLIELAQAEAADLMVLGTNQRRGLRRFWLGSVSRGVLHQANANIVCVPTSEAREAGPESIPTYRRVLVATDFSKPGNRAVAFAYGAAAAGGEVCLVHVIAPAGPFRPDSDDSPSTEQKRALADRLQPLVPHDAERRGIHSRIEVVEHPHPEVAICQAAERFGADLICLGSSGRSGLTKKLLGSVTEGVLRRSPRPVLVIRQ